MPDIHPTAIVSPSAQLADDVKVEPYAIIEDDVRIGAGCIIRSHAVIRRYTQMGCGNYVDSHAVLGGLPQDLKFDPATVTYLIIGDGNIFREGVTISRATVPGGATRVGNKTYWMMGAHAGHDAVVHDQAILVNGSAMAGHSTLGPRSILSGNVLIHQFCWVGEMVMTRGNSGASMHIPPFTMLAGGINQLAGLNTVGLRRAKDITDEDRRQIKEAFRVTYRSGLTPTKALEKMDACGDWGAPAGRFRDFVRQVLAAKKPYNRGLCPIRNTGRNRTLWTEE